MDGRERPEAGRTEGSGRRKGAEEGGGHRKASILAANNLVETKLSAHNQPVLLYVHSRVYSVRNLLDLNNLLALTRLSLELQKHL